MTSFERAMAQLPLVAILRGMQPQEAVDLGEALVAMGFALIEVPLNSPEALDSIDRLVGCCGDRALIGAGTVLRSEEVAAVAATGARLIVAPNADPAVIAAAKAHGMVCLPGVATPSEAFRALAAGADGLKAFPAEALPPAAIKAWRAVLPPATPILPVGGIEPASMAAYRAAGAAGFGLGSALYRPGYGPAELTERALAFVTAWQELA